MRDWLGTTIQREALTVGCPHCRAPAGELCVNGDQPLQAFPAHEIRIRTARQAQPPQPSPENSQETQ